MKLVIRTNTQGERIIGFSVVSDPIANLAFVMLERWGPVMAEPDGYDEAGRQKFRALTSTEITDKAFDISEAAFIQADLRGHLLPTPEEEVI